MTLLLSAFRASADGRSAEGVVTRGLVRALEARDVPFRLASSDDPSALGPGPLATLARWTHHPATHPLGLLARLADRLKVRLTTTPPLRESAWAVAAADRIRGWVGEEPDAVVWARATPVQSLDAALRARVRVSFPMVANYNDPLPRSLLGGPEAVGDGPLDGVELRVDRRLAEVCQAWTFPSRRLADLMSDAVGFDRARCFIIPHVRPRPAVRDPAEREPVLTYAGTFYSTVFTPAVREGLERYSRGDPKLRLRFVLKKPSEKARRWIGSLPGAELHAEVDAEELAALRASSSGLLVVSAPLHAPLLMTKAVEAVRSGLPVLALAPPGTTTADCLGRCGALVTAPDSPETVAAAVERFGRAVLAGKPPADSPEPGSLERFTEERIVNDVVRVMTFARERFSWEQSGRSGDPPEPPEVEAWP